MTPRKPNAKDICECGDFRRQHGPDGRCKLPNISSDVSKVKCFFSMLHPWQQPTKAERKATKKGRTP